MDRMREIYHSLIDSLDGSSDGVLGLDNVSESEVSFVDDCVAGDCRNWV